MEHPDPQSDVLARVMALVEPSPAQVADLNGSARTSTGSARLL